MLVNKFVNIHTFLLYSMHQKWKIYMDLHFIEVLIRRKLVKHPIYIYVGIIYGIKAGKLNRLYSSLVATHIWGTSSIHPRHVRKTDGLFDAITSSFYVQTHVRRTDWCVLTWVKFRPKTVFNKIFVNKTLNKISSKINIFQNKYNIKQPSIKLNHFFIGHFFY